MLSNLECATTFRQIKIWGYAGVRTYYTTTYVFMSIGLRTCVGVSVSACTHVCAGVDSAYLDSVSKHDGQHGQREVHDVEESQRDKRFVGVQHVLRRRQHVHSKRPQRHLVNVHVHQQMQNFSSRFDDSMQTTM